MPKIIGLPDGSEVEFPDEMPDSAVSAAVQKFVASQPAPEREPQWSDLPGNILPSAGRAVSDMAGGVLRGVKAMVAPPGPNEMISAGAGPVGLGILRGVRAFQDAGGVSGLGAGLKDRFVTNLKKNVIEDPVGMALDAASVADVVAMPLRGGLGLSRVAETAYGKALKVPDVIRKRNPGTNFNRIGLDARARVSGAGIEKIDRSVGDLERRVGAAVDNSPAMETLSPATMPASQAEIAASGRLTAANPDRANVRTRVDQFLEDPNIKGQPLTMRQVQDNKVEVGKLAYDRAAQPSMAVSDANQAIYQDLRGVLDRNVPEVAPVNAQLTQLYPLRDALTHRVPVAARRDVVPMAGAVGAQVVGGGGRRLIAAVVNATITNPAVLSQAAITMDGASQRIARLGKTAEKLAPFVVPQTLLRNVAQQKPAAADARERGQITTGAVDELTRSSEFQRLPVEQQDQQIQQLVSDVALLTGGVADVTKLKARSPRIIKGLMASHSTEKP